MPAKNKKVATTRTAAAKGGKKPSNNVVAKNVITAKTTTADKTARAAEFDAKAVSFLKAAGAATYDLIETLRVIRDEKLYLELKKDGVPYKSFADYAYDRVRLKDTQVRNWLFVTANFTKDQVSDIGMEVLFLYANHCRATKSPISKDPATVKVSTPKGLKGLSELTYREAETAFELPSHAAGLEATDAEEQFARDVYNGLQGIGAGGIGMNFTIQPHKDGAHILCDLPLAQFQRVVDGMAKLAKTLKVPK